MDIVGIIQALGFPAGVTAILLYDRLKIAPKQTEALNRLCILIEQCPKRK